MKNQITKVLVETYYNIIIELNYAIIAHYKLENKFTSTIEGSKNGKLLKKGEIIHNNSSLEFRFHGTGCEFKINGLIIDFDFLFDSEDHKITFGLTEFKNFVQSYLNCSSELMENEEELTKSLELCAKSEGFIFKL